jgi:Ca-activated chloride channel family protein
MRERTRHTFLKRLRLALLTAAFFWFFPTLTSQAKAQPVEPVAERPAQPAPLAPPAGAVGINDPQTGALLLKTAFPGRYVEAPLVAADVDIDVSGPIIRARVTQRFVNVTDQWVEGTYVFPLPADAGVDRLRMMIGDRFIEGEIHERQEARRIYEEARAAGVRASLVEQERPNMFTNSVANIGPGESVVVQIEYQDVARLTDGVFSLRFPMVVGPRYNPEPDMLQVVDLDPRTGFAANDPVPDRERISPPVMHPDAEPANGGMRLPVSITVNLEAGFALSAVTSPYHDIDVDFGDDRDSAVVQLADGAVPADRDFALEWRADEGAGPTAAAFTETREDGTYLLAMVTPPTASDQDTPRTPREAIFVIDNSGSMAGKSMPQAKAALILALERLQPEDTFNVVRFDDTYDVVFPYAVPATRENIAHARGYVSGLEAEGGTEMLPALRAALSDPNRGDATRVRQVVFLTDGAIGNEAQLFEAIDAGLGRSRLFTVGIGSAPNTYFMSRAARIGRGTFTHIGDIDEVQERADALFAALEQPVMTDLTAEFPDGTASEVWPNPLPDLYAGEPVVLTARLDQPAGTVRVSGTFEGRRWAADLDIANAAPGEGVAVLWARAKIASIEEQRFMGAAPETIDRAVLQTALDYGLVSRLTSLVAVDVEPARPANARLTRTDVPTMLPDGWEFDKVFGPEIDAFIREAALGDDLIEILNDANPAAAPQTQAQADGIALPRGGTTANIQIVLGLMLTLLGFAAWMRKRVVKVRK